MDIRNEITSIRKNYSLMELHERDVDANPIMQFEKWFRDAVHAEVPEVNAMTLATATKEGIPSARIVLLKQFDERGFVFFTNYDSRKGREISENPHCAVVLFWHPLERQVRISGIAEKISIVESIKYFQSRPIDSQLGAWASQQSSVVTMRSVLEMTFNKMKNDFKNEKIPLPPFWGGYRIIPSSIEFWQGRPNRLHDRLRYNKISETEWKLERLAP